MTIRIALVDDHNLVLRTLSSWVSSAADDFEVVASVASWDELLDSDAEPADVVLLDLDLGDNIPLAVKIATLRAAGSAVVVVSSFANAEGVRSAIEAGALSYVSKSEDTEELLNAIRAAASGRPYTSSHLAYLLVSSTGPQRPKLSEQEQRALCLYASGLPMKSVARQLGVTYETAKSYVDRVRDKYERAGREARTKVDLRVRAVEDGWLPDTPSG
jgi:two-component system uhpT operon response regulator UhpA